MKNFKYLLLLAVIVGFSSCYEDYEEPFEFSAMYFPYQTPLRTVLIDDTDIEIGIVLGGKRDNDVNEYAYLSLARDLVVNDNIEVLPSTHFTLDIDSDSLVKVPAGMFQGQFKLNLTPAFFDDEMSYNNHYVVPFRMKQFTTDSILYGKHYSLTMVKYINHFHGTYYRKGSDVLNNDDKVEYSTDQLVKNITTDLKTSGKNKVRMTTIGKTNAIGTLEFTIDGSNVTVAVVDPTDIDETVDEELVISNFTGSYSDSKLSYSYTYSFLEGDERTVTEELIFRDNGLQFEEWSL